MKILMVATCVLMFCLSPSHAWAQNCKPDGSGQDKLSKQQFEYWFKTVSTSGVGITVFVGRSGFANWVNVQLEKQEAAATSNTEFQSPLRAEKGNQFYFGLKNGGPLTFVSTAVSNDAHVSGSFLAGFTGKNLYTKVVLSAVIQDKDMATLRDNLTRNQIDAVRIVVAGDAVIQASVSDKDGVKLMEKFGCFYQALDKKGIDLTAPDPPPVAPSDPSISGRYIRRNKASDYIVLKPDGTFSLEFNGAGYGGNYKVQGDTLSTQVSHGSASTARVNGNTLMFSDGNVYERQAEGQKAEPQKATAAAQLTIDQIIQMVAAKLPDDVIIATIRKSGSTFDLTPDALIKLKTAGVSDAVLRAMMQ
ncbi:MAG TPA: hypothetical protein VI306_05025 [Pyrinomonadaceae bacterium]